MEKFYENIFKDSDDTGKAELWYKARHFVMDELPPIDRYEEDGRMVDGIAPGCGKHVHVVVDSIDEQMMAVVRQVCLLAHYPNFNEETGSNRTIITFCLATPSDENMLQIKGLGNLLNYCKCTIYGKKRVYRIHHDEGKNNHLPLDIEFEFKAGQLSDYKQEKNEILVKIDSKRVAESFRNYEPPKEGIDVMRAMIVNMVYGTGSAFNNLPAFDNDNVARYSTALNVFCYNLKPAEIEKAWKGCDLSSRQSSLFCADCFESRLKGILNTEKKSVAEHLLTDFGGVMSLLSRQDTINALSRCEHARWNVEKLIMGFLPLNKQELYDIECLFESEQNAKIKALKTQKRHIDLCSNRNLRRINPGNIKYDYFLMLAMPQIVLSSIRS